MKLLQRFLATTLLLAASVTALADTVVKVPDVGPYWNPLSSAGTYIYANSFVAPTSGPVSELGMWLLNGPNDLKFQIFGSLGGDPTLGPDSGNVLATTGLIPGQYYQDLTFVDVTTGISSAALVAGQTYWFAANAIGLSGSAPYYVGAHTQNSDGIVDNGTFWFSNDPTGVVFDGTALTPELAFSVSVVPEPTRQAMLGLGLVLIGVLASRRRYGA